MAFWRSLALVTAVLGIVGLIQGVPLPGTGLLLVSVYALGVSTEGRGITRRR